MKIHKPSFTKLGQFLTAYIWVDMNWLPKIRRHIFKSSLMWVGHGYSANCKKICAVRVGGDLKVTINPVLKVDTYFLPHIENTFAILAGDRDLVKLSYCKLTYRWKQKKIQRFILPETCKKGYTNTIDYCLALPLLLLYGNEQWIKC